MPLITVPGENDPEVEVHYEDVGAGMADPQEIGLHP